MSDDVWRSDIEHLRLEKDRFFGEGLQSPIPPQQRGGFRGLDYFPPDPALVFQIPLHEHQRKTTETMAYTRGEVREFIRWGEFRFEIDGRACALQAYKADAEEDRLFIPFRDETCGHETYGAGRYIDLNAAHDRSPDGTWSVDFNQAYNPWCCYSTAFTCPFVPQENWLPVPIRAGEKNYPASEIDLDR